MAKIIELFTRSKGKEDSGRSFDEILADLKPHLIPALAFRKVDTPTKSYFGGDPYLPQDVQWPEQRGTDLDFLASIDLQEVADTGVMAWLPSTGRLLFFYDAENQPWGFDPKDRGGWSVLYVNKIGGDKPERAPLIQQCFLRLEAFESVPDWQRFEELGIDMDDSEVDTYIDGCFERDEGNGEHQMGGYPRPVQGDHMELEAQLASNGVYCGDSSGYESEEGKLLAPGAKDWRLLFQFSSDDDLGVMWGDAGNLYFWVKEQDARAGDFSGAWLILQCC